MQIWNVYRSRAVGSFLDSIGIKAIPNVRWTDEISYEFAFAGIEKGSIVSVGTYGCSKKKEDIYLLVRGFAEMIKRIRPSCVVVYGPIVDALRRIIEEYEVNVMQFDSETHKYFGGQKTWE